MIEIISSMLWIKLIGLLAMLSSIIWALSKKKYDIAIGIIIALIAYIMITFIFM